MAFRYTSCKGKNTGICRSIKERSTRCHCCYRFWSDLIQRDPGSAKYGCVNIHASLLPKYRGAAPIQWAVIDGEKRTGVTTMMMDVGLDTGDILETKVIPLDPKETSGSLFEKLSEAGGPLILSTLEKLEKGTITRTPQGESGTSYAKMLTKTLGDINWTMSATAIERLIRGLNPWPSAYTFYNGKTLKIWDADVLEEAVPTDAVPGQVLQADKHGLQSQQEREF